MKQISTPSVGVLPPFNAFALGHSERAGPHAAFRGLVVCRLEEVQAAPTPMGVGGAARLDVRVSRAQEAGKGAPEAERPEGRPPERGAGRQASEGATHSTAHAR